MPLRYKILEFVNWVGAGLLLLELLQRMPLNSPIAYPVAAFVALAALMLAFPNRFNSVNLALITFFLVAGALILCS